MNTVGVSPISTTQVLTGTRTSTTPTRIRRQEIGIPRGSIGPQKVSNTHPLETSINQISPKHGHPTLIFSKLIGLKTVPNESADVYVRKSTDFGSNSVVSESQKFMDFGLLSSNTPDKLKSVIVPATRVGRLTNGSDWLQYRNDIEEVTVERVSDAKSYIDYILKMSLKL